MKHPASQALDKLSSEITPILNAERGSPEWFELQARGAAVAFLKGMIAIGAHHDLTAAECFCRTEFDDIDLHV